MNAIAASMRPRLLSRGESNLRGNRLFVVMNKLQWGRGFSAAESWPARLWQRPWRSFNGAAASQPRRVRLRLRLRPIDSASMGPRLLSRGEALPSLV